MPGPAPTPNTHRTELSGWPLESSHSGVFLRLRKTVSGRAFTLCFLTHSDSRYREVVVAFLCARLGADEPVRVAADEGIGTEALFQRLAGDGGATPAQLAVTQSQVADILYTRGRLDEALKTYRNSLAVFRRLAATRAAAITQGRIADILLVRGEWDEALEIHRNEELAVYERLGEPRSCAIVKGKIATILTLRGDIDQALRLRREEELPVYQRLGDVRSQAISQTQIANLLMTRAG